MVTQFGDTVEQKLCPRATVPPTQHRDVPTDISVQHRFGPSVRKVRVWISNLECHRRCKQHRISSQPHQPLQPVRPADVTLIYFKSRAPTAVIIQLLNTKRRIYLLYVNYRLEYSQCIFHNFESGGCHIEYWGSTSIGGGFIGDRGRPSRIQNEYFLMLYTLL